MVFQANPSEVIVRKQVRSVQFGFYNDQDVRDRSVAEITSSVAFDPNHTPLPGGLYDPRLGPATAKDGSCITCALPASACPGHFGHIELAVPVYHPLNFPSILNFLRTKCLACHRLKLPPTQLKLCQAKFILLQQNRMAELHDLDDLVARDMYQARENLQLGEASASNNKARAAAQKAMDDTLSGIIQTAQPHHTTTTSPITATTSYHRLKRKQLIHEWVQQLKRAPKCSHCGAMPPKIRHDSHNKIFRSALSKQHERINQAENIVFRSAMQEEVAEEGSSRAGAQRGENKDNYDSDDTDREGDDLMDTQQEQDSNDDNDQDVDDDDDDEDSEGGTAVKSGSNSRPQHRDKYMHPGEVQAQLKRTWELEPFLCSCLFGSVANANDYYSKTGYHIYFLQAVPVPPSRFRPPMYLNGMAVEHSQTQYLGKIIQLNELIRNNFCVAGNESRAYTAWIDLQTSMNCFMDSSRDPSAAAVSQLAPGIKQILERKEGLFRKNMMGKRVDFACRSVISPDPYIGTNEIGLPHYFATILTYPTPVTDLNIKEMRQLVERGPDHYPGARWVEISGKRVDLSKMNRHRREGVASQLLLHMKRGGMPALVGRQLRDGDYVLMNRQPTLHKPGIMAHRVRVLYNRNQRTMRMHYANCNTYNADFDGDEMNCHFPQSDLARAEAQYIAQTDLQYIAPTDGSPLRGLIQDHVVGGVKLTKRDTFLEKWEYQQLIFAALTSLPGLEVIRSDADIELLPPAIVKPRELWTGKQVISTLLLHLSKGNDHGSAKASNLPGLSWERKAKTPGPAFGDEQQEHLVLIRDGELLRGVLDKAAFGATDFSLVHAVYEAYGPESAGLLLNAFGRLFTAYIQFYSGHSCRVEDLVLTKESDADRRRLVERAYNLGARAAKAWADSEGGKVPISPVDEPGADKPLKPVEAASACAKIGELLSGNEGKENFARLDAHMQGQLNPLASDIVKKSLPNGLAVRFPYNTFGIMTTTGAKGSIVNQSQVTCALGQQALEGRRVPRMSSGRTLPSFAPYDPNPRADGFVMDRFLTGIRPQEYYFHCMAGREGLVDTAVKTSRSGYLQRCLIKHLEELKIGYDYTVRNAEGSVVQFLYGEDGLDPTRASYLDCTAKSFEYFARNHEALRRRSASLPSSTVDIAAADASRQDDIKNCSNAPLSKGEFVFAKRLRAGTRWVRGALLHGWNKAVVTKIHKNSTVDLKYLSDGHCVQRVPIQVDLGRCGGRQENAISRTATIVKRAAPDPILSSPERGHRLGSSGACVSEKVAKAASDAMTENGRLKKIMTSLGLSPQELSELIGAKYSSSLCAPGEAVGSIAAQSIGEPSTQMTLNTFHLAGAGANVTLGIPRLREIIMTASRELRTPTMSVPLASFVTEKHALRLTRDFTRLTLMELISGNRGISVTERLERVSGTWERVYYVILKLHPAERIREAFGLSLHDVARVVARSFVPLLSQYMKIELRRSAVEGDVGVAEVHGGAATEYIGDKKKEDNDVSMPSRSDERDDLNDDDQDDAEDDDVPGDDDGYEASRYRRRKESVSYDDDDDDDKESDHGQRSEEQTDHEGDANLMSQTPDLSLLASIAEQTAPKVQQEANAIVLQPLRIDPAARPLLMVGLVEKAAETTLVRSRKNIEQAFVNDEIGRGRCLQTAGINLEEMWQLETVDHNRLMSNDIWALRCAYGVEAARNNIVEQVTSVFGAYGIEVNPRHLSLIADYMTFDGGFRPMNRIGMEETSSTLLQMSFETTVHFLKQAAMAGTDDLMASPSANLVVGRPIQHGTGAFSLLTKKA